MVTGRRFGVIALAILFALAALMFRIMQVRNKGQDIEKSRFALWTVIDEFTFDKGRGPRSLEELVDAGYLRAVPTNSPVR
jgi:hypothetical protein